MRQSALCGGSAVRLTHEEMANDLGTAREVVTRVLRYFQSKGIVQVSRGSIRILDRKRLKSSQRNDLNHSERL